MDYIFIGLIVISICLTVVLLNKKTDNKDLQNQIDQLSKQLELSIEKSKSSTLDFLERQSAQDSQRKQELQNIEALRFKEFSENTQLSIRTLNRAITDMSVSMDNRFANFQKQNDLKLAEMRDTIEKKVTSLQEGNEKKLDEIKATVDEKLQKTLEERIGQSFKLVSERLEQVYQGLGEMKTLANGVGDLKNVLTNVKTRGIWGEIQLGAILEQILSPEQYETNVITKKNSSDRVEFAVKLPGEKGDFVYLPIDAKFPLDAYQNLVDSYDTGDLKQIEECSKILVLRIKAFAKDIHTKYIDVPNTTDFAIMFLPIEGLYAEVVRRGLVEYLQNDYKINIAGPTTMAALLNSLQMGFKTLAIQKRSGEVWEILGGVKQEFTNFEKVLMQAQKRMNMVSNDLETLVGTRTRAIQRKLRSVTEAKSELDNENEENLIDNKDDLW